MQDKWNERYGASEYFYGTEPNDFLRDNYSKIPEKGRVLCLAEGEGRNAVFLASKGYVVTAVDFSAQGLKKLQELASEKGVKVETVLADLGDYALGQSCWDGIVSIWCHLPPEVRKRLYGCVHQALKPGGVFLLEAYTPEQIKYKTGGPPDPKLMPSLENLRAELLNLQLNGEELLRDVREGQGHRGLSSVVQVTAKKN